MNLQRLLALRAQWRNQQKTLVWELQFLGATNDIQLRTRLFDNPKLSGWIPDRLTHAFYQKFRRDDPVYYSHAISTLLTLSLFRSRYS